LVGLPKGIFAALRRQPPPIRVAPILLESASLTSEVVYQRLQSRVTGHSTVRPGCVAHRASSKRRCRMQVPDEASPAKRPDVMTDVLCLPQFPPRPSGTAAAVRADGLWWSGLSVPVQYPVARLPKDGLQRRCVSIRDASGFGDVRRPSGRPRHGVVQKCELWDLPGSRAAAMTKSRAWTLTAALGFCNGRRCTQGR
jgi:hypothetical protein